MQQKSRILLRAIGVMAPSLILRNPALQHRIILHSIGVFTRIRVAKQSTPGSEPTESVQTLECSDCLRCTHIPESEAVGNESFNAVAGANGEIEVYD